MDKRYVRNTHKLLYIYESTCLSISSISISSPAILYYTYEQVISIEPKEGISVSKFSRFTLQSLTRFSRSAITPQTSSLITLSHTHTTTTTTWSDSRIAAHHHPSSFTSLSLPSPLLSQTPSGCRLALIRFPASPRSTLQAPAKTLDLSFVRRLTPPGHHSPRTNRLRPQTAKLSVNHPQAIRGNLRANRYEWMRCNRLPKSACMR